MKTMAAETPLKRQREEPHVDGGVDEDTKRQKPSYNHILSLLEDHHNNQEDQISNQDLSSLISSLQYELSSEIQTPQLSSCSSAPSPSSCSPVKQQESEGEEEERDDDKEKVFRLLLEASDDELGLPNRSEEESLYSSNNGSGDHQEAVNSDPETLLSFDGLWELEDEAANYYALLQSELFM